MPQIFSRWIAPVREWWHAHEGEIWWALVFAAACALAIELIKPLWIGQESYKVYLLGHSKQPDIDKIYTSFEQLAKNDSLRIDGIPIIVVRDDDEGRDDLAKTKAKEIAGAKDSLLVIGSIHSQETEAALPYLLKANPPIPVITLTESDDNLLNDFCKNCQDNYEPLLQMSPTNRSQAESAVRYATQQNRHRCLIILQKNFDNAIYAHNLIGDLKDELNRYEYRDIMWIDTWEMDKPPTPDDLKGWNADCIFYVGESGPAHALMNALAGYEQPDGVTVILSDSSVRDRKVMQSDPMNHSSTIFYTYASDAYYFSNDESVFAEDAYKIFTELLSPTTEENQGLFPPSMAEKIRRRLGIKCVSDARAEIIRTMENNALIGRTYIGKSGNKYEFANYQRRGAFFHVWNVDNGTINDVDGWHEPPSKSH